MAILGELARANLIDPSAKRVDEPKLQPVLEKYDISRPTATDEARKMYLSAPAPRDAIWHLPPRRFITRSRISTGNRDAFAISRIATRKMGVWRCCLETSLKADAS